eukprot:scaffold6710_cov267-Chaetoceros_neogracile.AAC.9
MDMNAKDNVNCDDTAQCTGHASSIPSIHYAPTNQRCLPGPTSASKNTSFPTPPRHVRTTVLTKPSSSSNKRRRITQDEHANNLNDNHVNSASTSTNAYQQFHHPNPAHVRTQTQTGPKSHAQPSIESILARNMPKDVPQPPSLFDTAHNLDFSIRPRPRRDGNGTLPINEKHGLKITADMKYLMMLFAIEMGYSLTEPNYSNTYATSTSTSTNANANTNAKMSATMSMNTSASANTHLSKKSTQASEKKQTSIRSKRTMHESVPTLMKNKKLVHEAACKIVCYDYGLLRPIGSTTLHKAFETFRKNKYVHAANLFETRHQDRGRTSYIQKIEESHPGHLKNVFLYAKERADDYTKYDDYRRIMMERSQKLQPDLNLKLTMNDLMNFFEKNPKLKPRGMPKRKKAVHININMSGAGVEGGASVGNHQFMNVDPLGDDGAGFSAGVGNVGDGDGLDVMRIVNNDVGMNPDMAVHQRQQLQRQPMDGMNLNLVPLHLTNIHNARNPLNYTFNDSVPMNNSMIGDDGNCTLNEGMDTDNLDNMNCAMGISTLPTITSPLRNFTRTLDNGLAGTHTGISNYMGGLNYPGEGELGDHGDNT